MKTKNISRQYQTKLIFNPDYYFNNYSCKNCYINLLYYEYKEFLRVHKIIIICSGQRKKIQKIISQQQDYTKTDMI